MKRNIFIPLRIKLIVPFFLLITIPFFISATVTYYKYSENEDENAREYTIKIIEQMKINLDRYIKELDRITIAPYYDESFMDVIVSHKEPNQGNVFLTNEELNKVRAVFSSLIIDRPEIRGMFYFANDGALFGNSIGSARNWTRELNQWMREVSDNGGLTILPVHDVNYYFNPTESVISVARLIHDPYTMDKLGIMKLDIELEGLNNILSDVSFSPNSKLFIFDNLDQLVYPSSRMFFQDQLLQSPLLQDEVIIDDETYISAFVTSQYSGLKLVGLVPKKDLRGNVNELTKFILYISIISLTASYLIAIIMSNRLVRPIAYLRMKMKHVQEGDLGERAEVKANDEVGQLTIGFNAMINEIERLVKEVYEIKLRESEAELTALQSQINPHFLYNTLESINMLAVKNQQYEMSRAITNLGKLLRYTVDRSEKFVYLRNEIAFIEAYLEIQSFRLEDRLNIDIHIDPSHEYALIPKLLLQPLIENVIEHGLRDTSITIRVYTNLLGDDLQIFVEDDGIGLNKQRLELIERRMYMPDHELYKGNKTEGKKGFALRNVHQRLRILYGETYGLYFDKSFKDGTLIEIRLPFQWEE